MKTRDRLIMADVLKGAWDSALAALEKRKVVIDDSAYTETVPSHSIALDVALGGGWPKGRVVVIVGKDNVGKTTLTREQLAAACRRGLVCLEQDFENKLDPGRRRAILEHHGVDLSKAFAENLNERTYLKFRQPTNFAEDAKPVAMALGQTGRLAVYVADSVPSMRSRRHVAAALEGDDARPGLHAAVVGNFVQDLYSVTQDKGVVLFFINQERQQVGGGGKLPFGAQPTYMPGGEFLKYLTTIRIFLRKEWFNPKAGWGNGWNLVVKVVKNHVNSAWTGELRLKYDAKGLFQWPEEALDYGVAHGFIERTVVQRDGEKKVGYRLAAKDRPPMAKDEMLAWIRSKPRFHELVRDAVVKKALANGEKK